jgi:hypothetical protein
MDADVADGALIALRRWVLGGQGDISSVTAELVRRYGDSAGIAIAAYGGGKQHACRVSPRPPDAESVASLLALVRSELGPSNATPVVLLSTLSAPRILSVDEYRRRGIRIGVDTLAVVRGGRVSLILAHVPCFMSWSSEQLGEAVVSKHGGGRPLEFHVFPTQTEWLSSLGPAPTDRGGLRQRRAAVGTTSVLREEIALVGGYLRGQLSGTDAIHYAYDPWRDRVVHRESVARKVIAIAAQVRAARLLGDARSADEGLTSLAMLSRRRTPVGDIDDAHLLLAANAPPGATAIGRIRAAMRESGAIIAAGSDDQEYFPGVVLTALSSLQAIGEEECARSLRYYRERFRVRPSWPALWWQARAWGAISEFALPRARDFVFELAEWAIARQLPSGAFDTGSPPGALSFQTACVAEGLLEAANTARAGNEPSRAKRYLSAALQGLQFSSSLVLDARHADLFPCPSRAVGGVRTWHGELLLRADVAGHYLSALVRLAELSEDA